MCAVIRCVVGSLMAWILDCGVCNKLGDGVSSTRSNEKEIVGVFVNLIGSFWSMML